MNYFHFAVIYDSEGLFMAVIFPKEISTNFFVQMSNKKYPANIEFAGFVEKKHKPSMKTYYNVNNI